MAVSLIAAVLQLSLLVLLNGNDVKALRPSDPLLGVHPDKLSTYSAAVSSKSSAPTFACLDASRSIPASAINDDYCDCEDGSDEPGTSACLEGSFYCLNKGHKGAVLASSRVNDGICDPECCDGSDEWDGSVKCPNTCSKFAEETRRKEEARLKVVREGMKAKKEYIAYGVKARNDHVVEIKQLDSQVSNLTSLIADLKVLKSDAEHYESRIRAAKARRDATSARESLPKLLKTCRTNTQSLRDTITTLNSRITQLKFALDHLVTLESHEEGAAFQALLRDKPILKETLDMYQEFKDQNPVESGGGVVDVNSLPVELGENDEPEVKLLLEAADKEQGSGSSSGSSSIYPTAEELAIEAALNDPCEDPTASLGTCLTHAFDSASTHLFGLVRYPLLWGGWKRMYRSIRGIGGSSVGKAGTATSKEEVDLLRTDVTLVTSRLSEAENLKRDVEHRLKDLKDRQQKDFGIDGEWEKVYKECISLTSFEYVYELCFMDKVTQKSKDNAGSTTHLGTFSHWGSRKDPDNLRTRYFYMVYENGAHCWNGPARSVEVLLSCGGQNKIVSVSEPSKCEYQMKVETPAACSETSYA